MTPSLLPNLGLACLLALAASGIASAQNLRTALGSADADASQPLHIQLGAGLESVPEYDGARQARSTATPLLNISYRSERYGTLALGTSMAGLLWMPLETPRFSAGLLLSYDAGRTDSGSPSNRQRPGSDRLRGMGTIKASVLYGGFVSTTVAELVELSAYALQAPRGHGTGGVHGALQATLPLPVPTLLGERLALSVSASVQLADRRYMQAYFGVDALQSQRSGLRAHRASAGLRSAGLAFDASYALTRRWSAYAALSAQQLQGSAADSPLTQRRLQSQARIGLSLAF